MASDPSVLFVHEGVASGPSATVRGLQYSDVFARRWSGRVEFVARKPDWHPRLVESKRRVIQLSMIAGKLPADWLAQREIARRTEDIVERARSFDLVYLLKVPSIELYRQLRAQGTRIVMDLNDALWLPFNQTKWPHLDEMIATASVVVCDNDYVAGYATRQGATARIVPDPAPLEAFDRERRTSRRGDGKTVLGWIGSPSTVDSLYAILEPLEALFARHANLQLRVVGAPADRLPRFEKVNVSVRHEYDQAAMIREVLDMDIGLFPMFQLEDSLARGILKATIYMAGEALVIAQNLGANPSLVTDGDNGLLADHATWAAQLERAVTEVEERRRMAARGLAHVRERYSVEACFERLAAALHDAALVDKPRTS